MAFASTVTSKTVKGNKREACGGFTQGNGDTGGDIVTGLDSIETFQMNAALSASASGGTVTVVTADPTAAQAGYWFASGY